MNSNKKQRDGAGAAYLNIFHYDVLDFLDSKKINADERIRLSSLSIGLIVPDLFFKLAKENKDIYLFGPHSVFLEYGVHLDEIKIEEYYDKLIDNPNIHKRSVNARDLLTQIATTQLSSGYPYLMFTDNANKVHALKEIGKIKSSNLCVAPDTKILTKEFGYKKISELENNYVDVWNGEEWSNVQVRKTGENQKLLKITTNNFKTLECTPYHKFYVVDTQDKNKIIEKRAHELNVNDKLIKFDLPNDYKEYIDETLDFAYENGFYSGDGCEFVVKNRKNLINKIIYLYGDKKQLLNNFKMKFTKHENEDRITLSYCKDLKDKFFVPKGYALNIILDWLSGLFDADGTISTFENHHSLQLTSINNNFLSEIQLMLQEIGVLSKIQQSSKGGKCLMPNGKNGYSEYVRKPSYRLLITHSELVKLINLGLKTHRLNLKDVENHIPNRSATQFEKIMKIEDVEDLKDTFCFTEPIRNMGMFNGILTGNCSEIFQLQEHSIINDYGKEDEINRDISCNLASLNIVNVMESKKVKESVYDGIDALNFVSDITNIQNAPGVVKANQELHSIGLGALNLNGYLAKNKIMYESEEAKDFANVFFMMMNYYSIKRSMEIARDTGVKFKDFERSEYANGNYFDKYINNEYLPQTEKVKALFEDINIPTTESWSKLKAMVMEFGMKHAYRLAIAPTQSIGYVQNATSSVMPIVDIIEKRLYGNIETIYPAPFLSINTLGYYKSAYEIDQMKLIDMVATIQEHIDQGISTILYVKSDISTRELARLYMYAHHKGLKSLYYTRNRLISLTECTSCSI